MASFTRESKFRHCVVSVPKREFFYENLRTQQSPSDVNGVVGNSKFFAYIDSTGSGSTLAVVPLTSVGKNHIPVSSPAYQQPIFRAHTQAIQDFDFSPFDTNQIYTCSADKFIKLWSIPADGLTVDINTCLTSFSAKSGGPIKSLSVHRSVDGLVAARGNKEVSLFNVSTDGTAVELFTSGADVITNDSLSMSWSFLGDLLVTTAKDKMLKLIDFRANASVVSAVTCHAGIRFSRNIWLGNTPYLATVGASSFQEREIMVWDSRNMSTALKRERIDSSTGSIVPLYDADHNLLVLAGKGDASIRMYEFSELSSSTGSAKGHNDAALFPLSNNPVGEVIRGLGLLPKQCNDLMGCEVLRLLKLTDNLIQPVSVSVTRKEKSKFQEDLFPPTYGGASAAATAEEWLSGVNNPPLTVPLSAGSSRKVSFITTGEDAADIDVKEPGSPVPTSDAYDARKSQRIASGLASMLKYRHMYGTEYKKDETFYNLNPDLSPDNPIIACSDTFFALPYRGGGGPVYVSKLSNYGKVEPDCAVLNGHKSAVQDISFSPFHSGLMVTGSNDCTIKIWDIESYAQSCADSNKKFQTTINEIEPLCHFTSHTNSIRNCVFHPTVPSLLVSTSQDMTLRMFDVNAASEISCLNIYNNYTENSQIVNISFNYDGCLIAVASKDRVVRIVDPRMNAVVASTESKVEASKRQIGRNLRTEWCTVKVGCDPISTVSSGSSGMRQIHLWDPRALETPIATKTIDNASGQLFPIFDEGLSSLFVIGKGDTIIRSYEIQSLRDAMNAQHASTGANSPVPSAAEDTPSDGTLGPLFFEKSTEYQSGSRDPIAGMCLLPKRLLDVRNIEVERILKLTGDAIIPITFKVPRADHLKQFFHDDIFPLTRSKQSEVTVSDWRSTDIPNSFFAPVLETLRPSDMQLISEKPVEAAPSEQKSKVASFRLAIAKQEEEAKIKEDNFAKLQKLAEQNAQYNINRSGPMKIGGVIVSNANLNPSDDVDSDDNWDDN